MLRLPDSECLLLCRRKTRKYRVISVRTPILAYRSLAKSFSITSVLIEKDETDFLLMGMLETLQASEGHYHVQYLISASVKEEGDLWWGNKSLNPGVHERSVVSNTLGL